MSRLTVYRDDAPEAPTLVTEDEAEMAAALRPIGVRFERWTSPVTLAPEDSAETILAAYKPYLDGLMGETGAGSADVIKLTPDNPNAAALRQKFLSEHVHTEDEVRFFVHGSGNFIMHVNGQVFDAHCVQGDLISVPAGTQALVRCRRGAVLYRVARVQRPVRLGGAIYRRDHCRAFPGLDACACLPLTGRA